MRTASSARLPEIESRMFTQNVPECESAGSRAPRPAVAPVPYRLLISERDMPGMSAVQGRNATGPFIF
jgi:hypothetical protein